MRTIIEATRQTLVSALNTKLRELSVTEYYVSALRFVRDFSAPQSSTEITLNFAYPSENGLSTNSISVKTNNWIMAFHGFVLFAEEVSTPFVSDNNDFLLFSLFSATDPVDFTCILATPKTHLVFENDGNPVFRLVSNELFGVRGGDYVTLATVNSIEDDFDFISDLVALDNLVDKKYNLIDNRRNPEPKP